MAAAAAGHAVVPLDAKGRLDAPALVATAARLAPPPVPLVWGTGLEAAPALLAALAAGREILGNDAAATRRAKEPRELALTLARLSVPHPEILVEPPASLAGWVARTTGGSGGAHVHPTAATVITGSAACRACPSRP